MRTMRSFLNRRDNRSSKTSSCCGNGSVNEISPTWRQAMEASDRSSASPIIPVKPPDLARDTWQVTPLLIFRKVMSGMNIPTLGLPKERFDQLRQLLYPAQRTQSETLHFVLALDEPARDAAFDMGPDHFIGIQLRRVGGARRTGAADLVCSRQTS